jgi:putative holliday junction resolvase
VDRPPETVLSFDFGLKRIGVAVGNSVSRDAQPLAVISAGNDQRRFDEIGRIIGEWQPQRLLVGRPSHPDGSLHEMTLRCERFARRLQGRFALPVVHIDERYTSVAAADSMRSRPGKDRIGSDDAEAAAIILRQYWSETSP